MCLFLQEYSLRPILYEEKKSHLLRKQKYSN